MSTDNPSLVESGFDIIPFPLGEDLALLTKNGWRIEMEFLDRYIPDVYYVNARRWQFLLRFYYDGTTLEFDYADLYRYEHGTPVEVKEDFDRLTMRRIAIMSDEAIEEKWCK